MNTLWFELNLPRTLGTGHDRRRSGGEDGHPVVLDPVIGGTIYLEDREIAGAVIRPENSPCAGLPNPNPSETVKIVGHASFPSPAKSEMGQQRS
jgi:hypothetical protein